MYTGVNVRTKENKDLIKKLNKHRRIAMLNESKLLKLASPTRKVFSLIFKLFTAVLIVFTALFVYSVINARRNGVVPRYAGISLEQVADTGSMDASGLYGGTNVLVYKVDPHTLKVGDIIAFYPYGTDYGRRYNETNCVAVTTIPSSHAVYSPTWDDFLGKINPKYI